jgi:hypothetical protein
LELVSFAAMRSSAIMQLMKAVGARINPLSFGLRHSH